MSALTGINRERITFSNHESQIAPDNEIRFIDAFVEEFISTVRGVNMAPLLKRFRQKKFSSV